MIRIITDTSADVTVTQAAGLKVELVPLDILFGEARYDPLADESFDIFYRMLGKSRVMPTTSQPSPERFLAHYQQAKVAGDDVIVITISSKLSGTWQSACIARDMAGYDRIHIIDSLQTIISQRLLIDVAVRMREEGAGVRAIVDTLEDMRGRIALLAGLDTLKYLEKGGRIPKSARVLGTMLGVKPLVELKGGKLEMAGKARGREKAFASLLALAHQKDDFDPATPVYFGYTGTDVLCAPFRERFCAEFGITDSRMYPIGAVVGTHVGPGAFAVVYLRKSKND